MGQIVNYGDNTLILAKAKNDASSMATALSEALASHPVGPLWSNPSDLVAPGHPFDFLGYTVECGADEYSVRPSDRNRVKFDHELHALINGIKRSRRRGQVPKKKIDRAHNVVRGWANAFAHWDGAERAKNKAFALIEMTAGDS